jgi:predicted GIY-YIG superfamily endonuclease
MKELINEVKKLRDGYIFNYENDSLVEYKSLSIARDIEKNEWILFVINGNRDFTFKYKSFLDIIYKVNDYYNRYNYCSFRIDPPKQNLKNYIDLINKIKKEVNLNAKNPIIKLKPHLNACIYGLYLKNSCVYIGQTTNIMQRIYTHNLEKNKTEKQFDGFKILHYEENENIRKTIESLYIIKHQPKLNKSKGSDINYGLAKQIYDTIEFK